MRANIKISAFRWVPPFAQGVVRDLRVRWALEEEGLDYNLRLIGPEEQDSASYRSLQPFGQVPSYEEDGLKLFESGAIVMHIAERSEDEKLMPSEPEARARTRAWMFAALNSVEPPIQNLAELDLFPCDPDVKAKRRPIVVDAVKKRLTSLSEWIQGKPYLEDRFTAADLLMSTVLRILRHTDLVDQMPVLAAYRARCEERPAFKRALAAQLEVFARHTPPELRSGAQA